ncbi:hypothetical protein PHAVU_008G225900 [Phaseolus vulgaris]|uniref:Uncharacterized protein n=1 Tax=Phaseolus vulgaris TaxID=3885 RepID=V7B7J6_PHAVU|nr:hypothetical protein PHAVU_008G225900g [Phaseolus vulgaris]ESW13784.1 hypothetical protein PHAVU_008G225900g [Phaseolus vulgaris]
MRGSCCVLNRRKEQRFRLLAISTVKSVKIKLLLCCCVTFTLLAFSRSAFSFVLWNNQTPLPPLFSDFRRSQNFHRSNTSAITMVKSGKCGSATTGKIWKTLNQLQPK